MKKRIAILTGGGDCPGLNAVIRAVVKKAILDHDLEVIGVEDGYYGLIHNRHRRLKYDDVSGILTQGGTILGTSNIANPYQYAGSKGESLQDVSRTALSNFRKLKAGCLVCIGGDGTLYIGHRLFRDGIPVIGVPKTIDNDIRGTDITFGFNTAVSIAAEAIDRLHTTAQSHHRVMIVEVMGRTAGWIALHAGIAGGGDIILLPEIPYDIGVIARTVEARNKKGKRFSIIVISEGARPKRGRTVVRKLVPGSTIPERLGGISFMLGEQLEKMTGLETRQVVLGHLQRGGTPTAFDRVLATQLGTRAAELIARGTFGLMVGVKGNALCSVPLKQVAQGPKLVPRKHPLVKCARSIGTCFGI